jgi:hypothetical protein
MFIANVNLSPTIAVSSEGVFPEMSIDLRRALQGLPTMRLATLLKQKNSASAVPSVAKKVNLYL